MVTRTLHEKKKRQTQSVIAVSPATRQLAEEVMNEGQHGTLSNTVEVALQTHQRLLRGELVKSVPR